MKKVLIIDLTTFFGGGQRFLINLEKLVNDSFEFHFAVSSKKLLDNLITNNKFLLSNSILTMYSDIILINLYVKKNNIDLLILNGNRPIYFSIFFRNVNKIAYKHTGMNAISNPFKKFTSLFLLNINYLFCSKIVLLYNKASQEVLLQKKKIVVIPNTIMLPNTKTFQNSKSSNDTIYLVCISRIEDNKGIKFLIETFLNTYNKFNQNVFLRIIGEGPLLDEYITFYERDNSSILKFYGFQDNIKQFLTSSDIFILPSKFEAFPLSILEAMSVGIPVISTNTGGIEDMVISGENGFLVNYNDSITLSTQMQYLIENKLERIKMSQKSLEFFNSKFSNNIFIENFKNLIK